jgi:hypothetical protein
MKLLIITLFLLSTLQSALAVRFSSRIHSIGYGKKTEPYLIKFDSGHVGYVERVNVILFAALTTNLQKKRNIEIVLDKDFNVVSAQSIPSIVDEEPESIDPEPSVPFEPSILTSYNSAAKILSKMKRNYKSSGQCFNRAHVWVYEEFVRSGLNSMKLFLFFTDRYIRKYRFHWWFHVTPMVYVGNTPRTLDRKYTSAPNRTKPWTDIFIRSKRTCPTISKFDDYANNQQKQDCYILPTSMYYVIPRDIEKRDLTGIEREEFIERDVRRAYKDAFIK